MTNNIMMDGVLTQAQVKLGDFKCSKSDLNSKPQSKTGTLLYMPPELQVYPMGQYDAYKADVFSLGVLFFFLYFGRYPFDDEEKGDCYEISKKIASEPLRENNILLLMSIPESPRQLMECMLTKNPRQRPSMSDVFDHPWIKQDYEESLAHAVGQFENVNQQAEEVQQQYLWMEGLLRFKIHQLIAKGE
eukprot:TRINITY_DN1603_c0_g1_i6.p2 TRINITY_DN1603_c0_g1~~TRINITY_DN1603_c0_g1_i6.p2  ORF type:complete len:189 (-),score=19.11 TRINITY_DN1603_c0_g1_i6:329-895(-)